MQLKSLLEKMIEVHASDVFIIAGLPLAYQASGSHVRTDTPPLTPADTQEYIETVYELAGRDLSLFADSVNHDDDFSFAVPASAVSAPTSSASAAPMAPSSASSPSGCPIPTR